VGAKLRLFFDICKFFRKKIQNGPIFALGLFLMSAEGLETGGGLSGMLERNEQSIVFHSDSMQKTNSAISVVLCEVKKKYSFFYFSCKRLGHVKTFH
jgi:hypothetical protein